MAVYSEKLIDEICEQLANSHKSIRQCCVDCNASYSTFKLWINEAKPQYKEYALAQYVRAKEEQIAYLADEILRLTYEMQELIREGKTYGENVNAAVSALRVQIDSLKWILSKLDPKKYGDKVDVTSGNEPINQLDGLPAEALTKILEAQKLLSGG